MKRARILFVSHEASRTGAPILLLHLLRWIRQHTPWELELLLADAGELTREFAEIGPTATLPQWTPAWTFGALGARLARRRLVSRLGSGTWSVVYSNTATNGEVLNLIGSRQPVISHVHELATTIHAYGPANFDAVRRHTTRYIACAEAVKRDLQDEFAIDPGMVDVVHGFVHAPPDQPQQRQALRCTIRKELGIPAGAFVVGAAGSVTWRKAPDLFIALARAVTCRCPRADVHFVWVGGISGSISRHDLEHDLRGAGLQGRVHFIGARPNALDYFHAFDVFAMVSREDPFPLVCLEAASIGTPVVCFDFAGGTKELVEQDCGFVVPYRDIDAMAASIGDLQQSEALRRVQGRRAAEKVRMRHDIDIAAPKIVEVIERLL